jgi:hypothetical protein
MKDIEYFLQQVDLIDLYITKNIVKIIKDKSEFDYIKSNLFLLGFNNKNRKNSLRILLDNHEFQAVESLIESYPEILNFKNTNKTNLLQMIITIDYFYDLIIKLIENLDLIFLTKILISKDNNNVDSIDLLLSIINSNQPFDIQSFINGFYKNPLLFSNQSVSESVGESVIRQYHTE